MTAARLPDFVIAGAMRSGTSSLNRYLSAHPDVFMAPGKEVHYFDRHHDRGLDWYTSHFEKATPAQVAGEATPSYMYYADAVDRMARTLPRARVVVLLRDPVERAYSHYWHSRARGHEPLSFEDAVAKEPERLAAGGLDPYIRHSYVDRSRYLPQLRRLLSLYPRDSVHVLLFEELRDAPYDTYAELLRFLEVDDAFRPEELGRAVNAFTSFRSVRLRNWARRLPPRMRDAIGRFNVKREGYPAMPGAVRRRLQAEFDRDRAELQALIGRDLSAWGGR